MAESTSRFDSRLVGTWRSDRRKTMKWFRPKPGCSPAALRKFRAVFGKLVVRWGRGRYYTDLDGHKDFGTYEVVARDAVSVVVRTLDSVAGKDRLSHIHFEGDHYWLALEGGRLCEFFRRVPTGSVRPPKQA